jgi:ADP-ribose pyrophosphatase YjhB (NUDIX family)
MWKGSAAICLNQKYELLMVLQGKPEEMKLWTVPSGEKEEEETFEECCMREVQEETGHQVVILNKLFEKNRRTFGIDVNVHYYEVDLLGGVAKIHDPDGLIYDIQWKSVDELKELNLSFPEDREFLINYINQKKKISRDSLL